MKKRIVLIGLLLGAGWARAAPAKPLMIGVRSSQLFDEGRLDGAIHLPCQSVTERVDAMNLDLDRSILVYCVTGKFAAIAVQSLEQAGCTQVTNAGGIADARKRMASPPAGSASFCSTYAGDFIMNNQCAACHSTARVAKNGGQYTMEYTVVKKGGNKTYTIDGTLDQNNCLSFNNPRFDFRLKGGILSGSMRKGDAEMAKISLKLQNSES